MQNKLFAAIAMIMVLMIGMTGFAAATTEDVTVSIGDGTGNVTIPVVAENVTNLGAYNIKLAFDPAVVSVVSIGDGDMGKMFSNIHTGWIHFGRFNAKNTTFSGNITLANVTFTPVDNCSMNTSELNLTDVVLFEATTAGNSIDRNIDNGVYTSGYAGGLNGDASGDDDVDMHDAMYIARYVISMEGYVIDCPAIADVDGDGDVDIDDAKYLANHLVGTPGYPLL